MKKENLLMNLRIVLWGLATLLFVVLTVLELIPNKSSGITVKEPIRISSASLSPFEAEQKDYTCLLTGILLNESNAAVAVESVRVVIGDGKQEKTLELEGFTLPARSTHEISVSFEDTVDYDRVKTVVLTADGTEDILPNQTKSGFSVSGVMILYFAGLILSGWFLYDTCKKRYYLWQEMQIKERIL